ncbi:uncharacterized protein LOC108145649 [Drosophila elegans]|uniref:uncharacterized protein LOC108145649 n=1 Tax=Drosophila elegans TaxID=30023 RepID=UPI0007E7C6E6|nr:uncharacterized protein LOC108145649 [Drosophila elegans]XP_017126689.1 uncharacterized protein LOC108145649 [Drosophila elegans]XP_017126693.1 uncharacterized protein LOC108145649 [Drosophila elegans]XP_041564021.1 uncharacterized protein LOC108145649 [Drosophila elegans]XP_041564022.1 uncharacterized protein LOC108145649 [Drosophila elegans]
MTDYMDYLERAWEYAEWLPYVMVTYVLITLLPKSLIRMKRFADADYEANRNNYHRCYGPELCCHVLAQDKVKPKARKPVTRVYPKRQQVVAPKVEHLPPPSPAPVKRSNVTKIARMFETGNTRQVSRVAPVTLPEIRMFGASTEGSRDSTPCASRKTSIASQLTAQLQHIEQAMHSMHLWQELEEESPKKSPASHSDWEPMAVPVSRRTRGTSATPSTASPLSSSPEPEQSASPALLRKPPSLCLQTSMEDIFQVIARSAEEPEDCPDCHCLSPVTCIDDILSERRFSRPLSAYSITDLLNEEQASCVEETTYINETR